MRMNHLRRWSRCILSIPGDRTATGEVIELSVLVPWEHVAAFHRDPISWLLENSADYPCARAAALVGGPEALRALIRAVQGGVGRLEIFRNGGNA